MRASGGKGRHRGRLQMGGRVSGPCPLRALTSDRPQLGSHAPSPTPTLQVPEKREPLARGHPPSCFCHLPAAGSPVPSEEAEVNLLLCWLPSLPHPAGQLTPHGSSMAASSHQYQSRQVPTLFVGVPRAHLSLGFLPPQPPSRKRCPHLPPLPPAFLIP